MEAAPASIRRARPLLGTFVEVAVVGAPIPAMETAVEAAFAAVATVHRLMSFHEATSDVSQLNCAAASRPVQVHDWTYQVLETARDLYHRSGGVFDITVASALLHLGLLPRESGLGVRSDEIESLLHRRHARACREHPRLFCEPSAGKTWMAGTSPAMTPKKWINVTGMRSSSAFPSPCLWGEVVNLCDRGAENSSPPRCGEGSGMAGARGSTALPETVGLLPDNCVRFAHRGVKIDLGGIAKGFAVDRAIEALHCHDVTDGFVSAGGDLAAFGTRQHAIDIRDPRRPDRAMCRVVLSNTALASSAGQFDPLRSDLPSGSAVIDPLTGRPSHAIRGATTCAPSCVIADALTKVVMNVGEAAAPILEHHGASALFVSAQGDVHITTNWKNEVHFAA